MKQKLKIYAVMAFLAITAVSCSTKDETPAKNDDPVNTDSKYMGAWTGTFTGGDSGDWTIDVDKDGKFTGQFTSDNSSTSYDFDGSVDELGVFSATIDVQGTILDFTGQGSADGTTASGTWGNTTANITGTWTGAKD